jgi:sialate O-acetylesterase
MFRPTPPLCLLLGLLIALPAEAEVKLPAIFSDHVVLQRDQPLAIWGWAKPEEHVTVHLGSEQAEATADGQGNWRVQLQPQPMSTAPLVLTAKGTNTLTVNDILLGDVWLCSGQSNMDMGLGGCNVPQDIASAELPLIRHFRMDYNFATAPAKNTRGQWSVCRPESAAGFSAVGFYFARKVQAATGVPIGILTNAVGGTNIELWLSQKTLLETPALDAYAKQMRTSLTEYNQQLAEALPEIEAWTARSRTALAGGQTIPLPPIWPEFPFIDKVSRPRCVTLHNGMISPLIGLALKGALWYQGENNADGRLYVAMKSAMVADWRRYFANPNLPFYFVQLAAWQAPNDRPEGGEWGLIRDAQRRCLTIPHTGMASAVDLGDAVDIHPKNKADVGERLALWALKNDYGKSDLVASGPLWRELQIAGNTAILSFDELGGGLMIGRKEGRTSTVEDPTAKLQRFAIAGADKKWFWAQATIQGDTVVVSAPEVPVPVAVRYAFCSNPAGANLYNRAGLPASPFRTDNW